MYTLAVYVQTQAAAAAARGRMKARKFIFYMDYKGKPRFVFSSVTRYALERLTEGYVKY